jgi:hypothetical protein
MRLGVFADSHDHLEHLREAVDVFNEAGCELVIFAGDLVSSIAVPPLRKLRCPLVGCFGDNEGNKPGVLGGMRIVGVLGEPPICLRLPDGLRVVVTHRLADLRGFEGDFDLCIYAHTHRANIRTDRWGRLLVNPGETSGWTSGRPTVALVETADRSARIVELPAAADFFRELADDGRRPSPQAPV